MLAEGVKKEKKNALQVPRLHDSQVLFPQLTVMTRWVSPFAKLCTGGTVCTRVFDKKWERYAETFKRIASISLERKGWGKASEGDWKTSFSCVLATFS